MLTRYSSGQVWKYKTRDHEADSRLTVVRVDTEDNDYGVIVHIYVSDVAIKNESAPDGVTTFVAHLPYTEEALDESVTELIEDHSDSNTDYEEGYQLWRKAYRSGEAGVFDIPVAEAISFVEESFAKG